MYKPTKDNVLVKVYEDPNKSGIILINKDKQKPSKAVVIDIGNDPKLVVKPGDKVLIEAWAGTNMTMDGQKLMMLKEEKILGIIEE